LTLKSQQQVARSKDIRSCNFSFLRIYEPQFERLGALDERYFRDDPNACLVKLRQFGELLAQEVAAPRGETRRQSH